MVERLRRPPRARAARYGVQAIWVLSKPSVERPDSRHRNPSKHRIGCPWCLGQSGAAMSVSKSMAWPIARAHGVQGNESASAFEIASEIEDVGGEINAATSVETTSYYARVLSDDVPLAVDILADILQESEFDPQELEREQHVILQEIGAAHDTPDDIVFDRFTETAFRHQTIGRSILGTPETVKSFTSKQLHDFIERQYGAERMVIVAAGDIKH